MFILLRKTEASMKVHRLFFLYDIDNELLICFNDYKLNMSESLYQSVNKFFIHENLMMNEKLKNSSWYSRLIKKYPLQMSVSDCDDIIYLSKILNYIKGEMNLSFDYDVDVFNCLGLETNKLGVAVCNYYNKLFDELNRDVSNCFESGIDYYYFDCGFDERYAKKLMFVLGMNNEYHLFDSNKFEKKTESVYT